MSTYQTGAAFRRALEDRLLTRSNRTAVSLIRLRKLVAFDRFLARMVQSQPGVWMLKGGLAFQMRIGDRARTTKDIDILLTIPTPQVQRALNSAASLDLGDWFGFTVRPATSALPAPNEGGTRFFVTSRLDSRIFETFHVDVGVGDPVIEPAENFTTPPLLTFADIDPIVIPCYPLAQHLAEKMHAYVRPRATGESTRVKDLIDILLAAELMQVNGSALLSAIRATFAVQADREPPSSFPDPPKGWAVTFRRMAEEVGLSHTNLVDGVAAARRFLEPALNGVATGTWSPIEQTWLPINQAP